MSKIRNFATLIETEAMEQVERTASMPFVKGVAVMPDVHFGKGSTVGTVVATQGAVMPACVGVDIGCGMIAVRTNLRVEDVRAKAREIREGIERRIPLGIGPRGKNTNILPSANQRVEILRTESVNAFDSTAHMDLRSADWSHQLGSLGGGNHFIEVCVGHPLVGHYVHDVFYQEPDLHTEEVWVILHSGSRAVGNKTGVHWTNIAKKQAKRLKYDAWLPDPDLAYLVEESDEYHAYLREAMWCQRFAALNREEMMDRVLTELAYQLRGGFGQPGLPLETEDGPEYIEVERINCHHNYISEEWHDGEKVLITRKGAIRAIKGELGLIPGSMGARSFITAGLGNRGAYCSAPHGAGRKMSRRKAREQFNVEGVAAELAAKGIEARVREAIVDEAPGSYKDIDTVMYDARELVRPTHVLSQIISVKGD